MGVLSWNLNGTGMEVTINNIYKTVTRIEDCWLIAVFSSRREWQIKWIKLLRVQLIRNDKSSQWRSWTSASVALMETAVVNSDTLSRGWELKERPEPLSNLWRTVLFFIEKYVEPTEQLCS